MFWIICILFKFQVNANTSDYVAVETDKTSTNMRRLSKTLCTASQPRPFNSEIKAQHQTEATACYQAKQQLIDAKDEKQVEAIERKISGFYDH